MNSIQRVKIDCEQIVDTLNMSIEVSKLTCKICCYLLINPRICYNKRCGQIYCSDCITTSEQSTPCPFCNLQSDRMKYSTNAIDPDLVFVLNNLKVMCKHITCQSKIFQLSEYMAHITEEGQKEKSRCSGTNCDAEWNQLKACVKCQLTSCKNCDMLYYIKSKIQCRECIEKDNADLTFDKPGQSNCASCKKLIKVMTNPFVVSKCAVCSGIFCVKCVRMCPICRQDACLKCFETCSQCNMLNNNSHACKSCYSTNLQLALFHKCPQCKKKYCLNCVSTCNVCHVILCCEDSNKCKSCNESVCLRHLYSCGKCSNKKVCLKQCTYTCQICLQKTTSYCNEAHHPVLSQAVVSCSHHLCTKCVYKCSSCKSELCQLCNTAKMFHCSICNSFLCFKCTNFCFKCCTAFCLFHKCIVCSSAMEDCFSCYIKETKLICQLCDKDLENCDDCLKKCICSFKCYVKYCTSKQGEHYCPMFLCGECQVEQGKRQSDKQSNNDCSYVVNDDECYFVSRSRKKINDSDKVMIACQESCICIIF